MVRINQASYSVRSLVQDRKQKHRKAAVLFKLAIGGAALAVSAHAQRYYDKQPIHTSLLTGEWLKELMTGHPIRFYRQMGMERFVFRKLLHQLQQRCGLRDTRYVICSFRRKMNGGADREEDGRNN
ncbi:hypothetical protein H0H92_006618, partial [Tricholoma furcatifolium]